MRQVLVVVGTPRSGNTATRTVLAHAYGLAEAASHDPLVLQAPLSRDAIVQVHAPYSCAAESSLRDRGFSIVTPVRHPLDVLVSMLHFAQFEPQVNEWLGGRCFTELVGATPADSAFSAFAFSECASRLLSISVDWARVADVTFRYRDIYPDMTRIADLPGLPRRRADRTSGADDNVTARLAALRSRPNMHAWIGTPDYWMRFIPIGLAEELRQAHPQAFAVGRYTIDGAQHLTSAQIERAWANAFHGDARSVRTPAAAVPTTGRAALPPC